MKIFQVIEFNLSGKFIGMHLFRDYADAEQMADNIATIQHDYIGPEEIELADVYKGWESYNLKK